MTTRRADIGRGIGWNLMVPFLGWVAESAFWRTPKGTLAQDVGAIKAIVQPVEASAPSPDERSSPVLRTGPAPDGV